MTQVGKVELEADKIRVSEKAEEMPEGFEFPTTQEGCRDRMLEINQHVKDVSFVRQDFSKGAGSCMAVPAQHLKANTPFLLHAQNVEV